MLNACSNLNLKKKASGQSGFAALPAFQEDLQIWTPVPGWTLICSSLAKTESAWTLEQTKLTQRRTLKVYNPWILSNTQHATLRTQAAPMRSHIVQQSQLRVKKCLGARTEDVDAI